MTAQGFQDFIGRRVSGRAATRIFHWRIRRAVRRGQVKSASVVER